MDFEWSTIIQSTLILASIVVIPLAVALIIETFKTRSNHNHLEAHPIFEDPNSLKQVKCPYIHDPPEKYISLIVPAYNEELRLPAALDETMNYLQERAGKDESFTYEPKVYKGIELCEKSSFNLNGDIHPRPHSVYLDGQLWTSVLLECPFIDLVAILVKGHTFPTNVKVYPVGCDPLALVDEFTPIEDNIGLLETRFDEEAVLCLCFLRITQKFVDEIGELRAISDHMLGAAGVQIPENNLDNLHSSREEDGILEFVDPQD
nr:dolichyl-phosphate beta-glucosyltransferase [Tanacetum cinerariifolium]